MTKFESPRFNSKANSKKYEDNYDRIFKKDKKEKSRIDIVGQNGNDGDHYDKVKEK